MPWHGAGDPGNFSAKQVFGLNPGVQPGSRRGRPLRPDDQKRRQARGTGIAIDGNRQEAQGEAKIDVAGLQRTFMKRGDTSSSSMTLMELSGPPGDVSAEVPLAIVC
jgi:hypothetical protein